MSKLFFLLLLFLTGCEKNETTTEFSGHVMTMDYRVVIGQKLSSKQQNQVKSIILKTFEEVDTIHNKWNPDSELSKLNALKAGVKVSISEELEELLDITKQVVTLTEGRFDPTIEPIQKLWKERVPSEEELTNFRESTGFDRVHFHSGTFWKDHDVCSLDLGGIAKGHCVDLIVKRLKHQGFNDVFVEWGGEIHASGHHPEGRPWNIFISHLGDPDVNNAVAVLPLRDQAIATSGDYLQNWSLGNTRYCHIIDPSTHHPLTITNESISSASVLADSCALADGLATAAMIFPSVEEAQEWAIGIQEKHPEIQFWILQN